MTKHDPINIRLDDQLERIVEKRLEKMRKAYNGIDVSRSDAIREIIRQSEQASK